MASARKRLEQILFGLYIVAGAVGMMMEAIAQVVGR
ncbi:hypothetical protein CI1B_59950 [Bradyrhizobium ivorense]|uniref:Uncharacterized protein n=1 Tax=Bradyrhizobium ivorense TaxID=2511166 RepID=A0A508TN03_9BRAD|nr:hypothetical protein CI41S_48110 [Bradyrhizobium ivorense]VIO75616.1 hypothetical protein CI1B_59950 [Bradyrhizobium ivorense]